MPTMGSSADSMAADTGHCGAGGWLDGGRKLARTEWGERGGLRRGRRQRRRRRSRGGPSRWRRGSRWRRPRRGGRRGGRWARCGGCGRRRCRARSRARAAATRATAAGRTPRRGPRCCPPSRSCGGGRRGRRPAHDAPAGLADAVEPGGLLGQLVAAGVGDDALDAGGAAGVERRRRQLDVDAALPPWPKVGMRMAASICEARNESSSSWSSRGRAAASRRWAARSSGWILSLGSELLASRKLRNSSWAAVWVDMVGRGGGRLPRGRGGRLALSRGRTIKGWGVCGRGAAEGRGGGEESVTMGADRRGRRGHLVVGWPAGGKTL